MTHPERPSSYVAGASGVIGGALLLAGEPFWALLCGAVVVASGGWNGLRRRDRAGGIRDPRISLPAAAALAYPGGERGWSRGRLKFLLRAGWQRQATTAWVNRLARTDVRPLWDAHPRLVSKLQRPYLRARWTLASRLEALTSHYDLLREILSPSARAAVYRGGLTLVRIVAPTGRALDLRLVYRDQFEKEGELTLTVEDVETTLLVAGMSFCLTEGSEHRIAWIGALQASSDPRTRPLIHEATKALHGLRPKGLALWALRQLGVPWQVTRLSAVADEQQVSRLGRKRRAVHARYDEFWAESGGVRVPGGDWDLPLTVPARPREEIKPSRRRAHELRYAMLADLRAELLAANAAVIPEAEPAEAAALPRLFRI